MISAIRSRETIREWRLMELLKELAQGANPRVGRKAVVIMGDFVQAVDRTFADQLRPTLASLLKSTDRHVLVRKEAAVQLGRITTGERFADAEAVAALVAAATPGRTSPPEVVAAALKALGTIGDPRGRNVIRDGLNNRDQLVGEAALEALVNALSGDRAKEFLDPALGNLLLGRLTDQELAADTRAAVIEALGRAIGEGARIEADQAFAKIIREDAEPTVVIAALKAVGFVGSPASSSAMIDAFRRFAPSTDGADEGSKVRSQVCVTAGELFELWSSRRGLSTILPSAQSLVDLLSEAIINGKNLDVRKEAAIALGNLYDRRYDRQKAVATLVAVIGTPKIEEDLKKAAIDSLEVLTGRSFGMDAERYERWYRKNESSLRPGR
jgi:HEAT repeat protein